MDQKLHLHYTKEFFVLAFEIFPPPERLIIVRPCPVIIITFVHATAFEGLHEDLCFKTMSNFHAFKKSLYPFDGSLTDRKFPGKRDFKFIGVHCIFSCL